MAFGLPSKIADALPSLTDADNARIRQLVADGVEDCDLSRGFHVGGAIADDDAGCC